MPREYDKHYINVTVEAEGFSGGCCDTSGNFKGVWQRALGMLDGRKLTGWVFHVTLKRNAIEITAQGTGDYASVFAKAKRIMMAAERQYYAEHGFDNWEITE